MPSVLVTGANRGIGREFVRQYAAAGWQVIATCRNPDTAMGLIASSPQVSLHQLELTDERAIARLAEQLYDATIDVLINNAAAQGPAGPSACFGALNVQAWLDLFHANVAGPLKLTESLIGSIGRSRRKLIVFLSSRAGSISLRGSLPHHRRGGSYLYRSSKAALNAAAKSLAFDLEPEGIGVLVLHPGWVRTEIGGPGADIEAEESVAGMRAIIDRFSMSQTGSFRNYTGEEIPW